MKKVIFAVLTLVPTLALANPGPYIQGQAGTGGPIGFLGVTGGLDGGYLWGDNNINYGVELGVTANSSTDIGDSDASGFGINLLGILKYTFNSGFVTLAKAGLLYLHQTQKSDGIIGYYFPAPSQTSSALGPQIALGIGYQFNPHWEIDLTADGAYLIPNDRKYNIQNGDFTGDDFYNADVLLGLTYHFA